MFRFATVVQRLGLVLTILLAFAADGHAQQAPLVGIDPIRASLDQIETTARRGNLSVRALNELQQALGPLRDELRAKLSDLEPRLVEADRRLHGLGHAPARGAEDASIAAERARLTQNRNELDSAVKQARLLQARADQLATLISDRRRTAFAETVFERTPSVIDPFFWRDVAAALPADVNALAAIIKGGWTHARDRANPLRLVIALAGIAVFAAGMMALARWWRRRVEGSARLSPAASSLLAFLRAALTMPLIVVVVTELIDQVGLMSKPVADIVVNLAGGVVFAAFGRAAAIGVFAPDNPQRRIVALDDARAQALSRHLVWGSRALGVLIFLLAAQKDIASAQVLNFAVNALFATAVLAVLVHMLYALRPTDADFGTARPRTLWIRPLAWIAVAAISIALLGGYIGFAAFVAGRAIFTVIVLGILYLLLVVSDRLIGDMLSADSPRSRAFAANLGIDPRRLGLIGTLLSGAVRAVFVLLAIALAIGPWEIAASDLSETARRAVFGLRIGDISISFGTVFSAVIAFAIIVVATRIVQRWLETRLLPATEIEPSLRLSIATVFGYVGFILALVAAMAEIGIDPQKIALVAGALSVGIGFGLQSIVSNFVSGLILLAERPIRVGDQIVVKGDEGFVRRISVRATEIETFDRASVIIPNSELITGVVKNWTHANTLGRLNIRVATGYEADAEKVIEILKACVAEHPGVLKQPAPAVLLAEFGATAMTFDIFCVVPNLGERGQIKSDIQIAILRQFRAAGIALSPPQDVRLVTGAPQGAAAGTS